MSTAISRSAIPISSRTRSTRLLSKDYAAEIRAKIDAGKAATSTDVQPGVPPHEGTETTHYSIVDKDGNAVSITYTINANFGAKVIAGDTGFFLNDEMDDFTTKPGAPNLFGLVQGKKNAIEPGKRPLSSMSPTIVTKDGKIFMVIGSPGGSRIITITLETVMNVIDYGSIRRRRSTRRASITSGCPTRSSSNRWRCRPTRSGC